MIANQRYEGKSVQSFSYPVISVVVQRHTYFGELPGRMPKEGPSQPPQDSHSQAKVNELEGLKKEPTGMQLYL